MYYNQRPPIRTEKRGFSNSLLLLVLVVGLSLFPFLKIDKSAAAPTPAFVRSGVNGYCLDDYRDKQTADNKVDLWGCNNSRAQNWVVGSGDVKHGAYCLAVANDSKSNGSPIVAGVCGNSPGQVWLSYGPGLYNPNSGLCLAAPHINGQLTLAACNNKDSSQAWTAYVAGRKQTGTGPCTGAEGQAVACYAEKAFASWQSGAVSHESLLNTYTDGAAYEEWCADFVSYVYKEAGYPFVGAYDGWDENNANNISNYGFSVHLASSGYVPQTGDVAYFDYSGGHVEVVVSGGKTPTFIYGDSAQIDPSTGNGQMKANTILKDGPEGSVVYYMTPN